MTQEQVNEWNMWVSFEDKIKDIKSYIVEVKYAYTGDDKVYEDKLTLEDMKNELKQVLGKYSKIAKEAKARI